MPIGGSSTRGEGWDCVVSYEIQIVSTQYSLCNDRPETYFVVINAARAPG